MFHIPISIQTKNTVSKPDFGWFYSSLRTLNLLFIGNPSRLHGYTFSPARSPGEKPLVFYTVKITDFGLSKAQRFRRGGGRPGRLKVCGFSGHFRIESTKKPPEFIILLE